MVKVKYDYCKTCGYSPEELCKQIDELESKLAEKEKEIERLKVYDEYRFELPYPKVRILGKTFEDINEITLKWIEKGKKDKILFCIDQLTRLRNTIVNKMINPYCVGIKEILSDFENQIRAIKEME